MKISTRAILTSKWVILLLTFAFLAVAYLLVGFAYRPEGPEALKTQIEAVRNEMEAAQERVQAAEKAAQQARAEGARRIEELTEQLRAQGVDIEAGIERRRQNVRVRRLEPEALRDVLVLPATAEAVEDIELAATNGGTVEWIGPEEGERVRKGQEIARIDAEILLEQLKIRQAAAKLARVNYQRIEKLAQRDVSSEGELDQARATLDQAEAELAIAEQARDDAVLTSPVDGVVDELFYDEGEFVQNGQPFARIVDISRVKLKLAVPEKDIAFFEVGQPANVRLPEPLEGWTSGTITRISLVADEATRTFRVEVTVPNDGRAFRPGMITRAELTRRSRSDAIVVPLFAMLQTEAGPVVYVENGGKAHRRPVKTGIRRGTRIEIVEGLESGDRLIVAGQRTLNDGAEVRVVDDATTLTMAPDAAEEVSR